MQHLGHPVTMLLMNVTLACTCGQKVVVSFQDAGRQKTCVCGQAMEVPRLSELRKQVEVVIETQKLEGLSSQQIYGRYILGGLLGLGLLGMLYDLFFPATIERHYFNIWKIFGIAFYGSLVWFTLLGRIWARLMLIVWLLFWSLLIFLAFVNSRDPVLVSLLLTYAVLIVCLMTIKT